MLAYLKALLRHWKEFALTGGLPAALGIAASVADKDVPTSWWVGSFALGLVVAQYRVYRDETARVEDLRSLIGGEARQAERQERQWEIRDRIGQLMREGDILLREFRQQLWHFDNPGAPVFRRGDPYLEPSRSNQYREWLSDVRGFLESTPELGLGALADFDAVDGLPVVAELTTWNQLRQIADAIAVRNKRLSTLMGRFA